MPDSKFFELKDHVGVDGDGNLEPLVTIGVAVTVPAMVGKDVIDVPEGLSIEPAQGLGDRGARIVPGTRIVESADWRINAALLQADFEQVDKPTKTAVQKAKKETVDSQERATEFNDDGEEKE